VNKFVRESIEDILKPKAKEEIQPHEDKAIENAEAMIGWIEDELEFLADIREKGIIDENEWQERYSAVYRRIEEAFYELPEYLRDRYDKKIEELHNKIDALLGINESLNEQKKLGLSAGFAIIQDNQILLVHPTNAKWTGSFSLPKGHLNPGEDFLDAAKRETREEIGYKVNPGDIHSGPHFVDYTDKKGKLYKRVYYYVVKPSKKIKKKDLKLQKSEVDWAGFLSKQDAKKRIHHRFKSVLKYLK